MRNRNPSARGVSGTDTALERGRPERFRAGSTLRLWLRADLGVTLGTGVSTWADQSGNGLNLTQATGAKQPTYTGSINGRTCPRFDGAAQYMKSSASATLTPTALTLLVVSKTIGLGAASNEGTIAGLVNGTSGYTMTHYQANGSKFFYINAGGNNATYGPGATGTAVQNVGWFDGTTNAAGLRIYENNVQKSAVASSSATYTGTQAFQVGLQTTEGSNYWNGDILEVILYSRTLGTSEMARLYSYQRTLAGLP